MPISYNAFNTPSTVTYTSGGTTQRGLGFTGASSTTIHLLGTGNAGVGDLTYDQVNGQLTGVLNEVHIVNATNDYSMSATNIGSSNNNDIRTRVNTFVQGAILNANRVQTWLDQTTAHLDTASVAYASDGTSMTIPMKNASNAITGFLYMTGKGLSASALAAGSGTFYSMQHLNSSSVLVTGEAYTYGTTGTPTTSLMYAMLKLTNGAYGNINALNTVFNAKDEVYTPHITNCAIDGGAGNDTYVLGSLNATITDSAGIDTISSSITRSIASLSNIEKLVLTGSTAIDGTGNGAANTITGNTAANTLTAGAGNDTVDGGAGNDTLNGGDGNDSLTGGLGLDTINGNAGTDTIRGGDAIDTIYGGDGNDTIYGDAGNDYIHGGAGRDIMTGATGGDYFVFDAITDSGKTSTTRDLINDFIHNQTASLSDHINLQAIDAKTTAGNAGDQAFSFIGKTAFTGAAGQLRYYQQDLSGTTSDRTFIEGDVNGDKIADFQIELVGLKNLVSGDFVL